MGQTARIVAAEEQDMTTDDILRMAREAGLQPYYDAQEPAIERFFKLAYEAGAAAERSRMIADGWRQCAQGQRTTQWCAQAADRLARHGIQIPEDDDGNPSF
jgi:hypothetical protein